MNPTDPSDPLLDALLTDRAALDAMHAAGLAALRRRRWWRIARWSVGTAAAAACFLFIMHTPQHERGKVVAVAPPPPANAPSALPPDPPSAVGKLDDDELVRQFPPGTCTIAEVDGRKMLVFLTDEARAKYLR